MQNEQDEKPVLENQEAESTDAEVFQKKAEELEKEMNALSEKYGVDILYGANFKKEKQIGVMYAGEHSTIIQNGLAKLIEQKFVVG